MSDRESQQTRHSSLFDRRVLFVVGKGGVGKSVVVTALALQAVDQGLRVCIAEMNGAESTAALLGCPPVGYRPTAIAEGIEAISITAEQATEEYLLRTLRFRKLYDLVFRNRYIEPFMNGILGLSDLTSVGKVMDLEWQRADGSYGIEASGPARYDLVVVDCPSTGHGLALLKAPQTMMDVTSRGPLYNNSAMIRDLLCDRTKTAVLLVTLAEEMPVAETLESVTTMRESLDIALAGVVMNAVPPPLASANDLEAWWPDVAAEGLALGGHCAGSITYGEQVQRLRGEAARYIERIYSQTQLPVLELPLLGDQGMGADGLRELGEHIGRWQT
jgi:anion-transporting  ArsA/GET3 family ATPase